MNRMIIQARIKCKTKIIKEIIFTTNNNNKIKNHTSHKKHKIINNIKASRIVAINIIKDKVNNKFNFKICHKKISQYILYYCSIKKEKFKIFM